MLGVACILGENSSNRSASVSHTERCIHSPRCAPATVSVWERGGGLRLLSNFTGSQERPLCWDTAVAPHLATHYYLLILQIKET